MQEKGLLSKADDYLNASGKLAAILYKEEIERALKTPGFSGFQLLDLHDFPGQGTALVGLLDAFWDSKGIVAAEDFRNFCSPVVPLTRFPKAVYTNNELFEATVEIANYAASDIDNKKIMLNIKQSKRKYDYKKMLDKIEKEIELINNNIDKMYIDKLNNKLSEEMYERLFNKLKKAEREKKTEYIELKKEEEECVEDNDSEIERLVKEFLKLEKPTPEIMRVLINRIEIHQDKQVDLLFNFKKLNNIELFEKFE